MDIVSEAWAGPAPDGVVLSIVITTFNYRQLIERAVQSVLSQLDASSELLVIDDGSKDGTDRVLERLAVGTGMRAAFLHQSNSGPAAARNAALRYCSGTWVLFLDGDDMLQPRSVSSILDRVRENPQLDLLLGGQVTVLPNGREKYRKPSKLADSPRQRLIDYLIYKRTSICHGCAVFRRTRLEERPYPEHLRQGEDIAVFAYMLSCPVCETTRAPLATIFKHPDSLRNDAELAIQNNELITEAVFDRLPPSMDEYRKTYEAKRALSAFRTCYRAGRFCEAKLLYALAFKRAPAQALRWGYLWKWMRISFTLTRSTGRAPFRH